MNMMIQKHLNKDMLSEIKIPLTTIFQEEIEHINANILEAIKIKIIAIFNIIYFSHVKSHF